MPASEIDRLRARALRAARAVTTPSVLVVALALTGCYAHHDLEPEPPDAALPVDPPVPRADAGPCEPDPACADFSEDCDWERYNACCEAIAWMHDDCYLPGGPMTPPEMPA